MFLSVVRFDVTARRYKSILSGFSNVYRRPRFIISCHCHAQNSIYHGGAINYSGQTDGLPKPSIALTGPIPMSTYIFRVIYFLSRGPTLTLGFLSVSSETAGGSDCLASADTSKKKKKSSDQSAFKTACPIHSHSHFFLLRRVLNYDSTEFDSSFLLLSLTDLSPTVKKQKQPTHPVSLRRDTPRSVPCHSLPTLVGACVLTEANLQPTQPGGRLSECNKMVLTFASVPHSSKTIRIISFNDVIDRRAPATLCQRAATAAFTD